MYGRVAALAALASALILAGPRGLAAQEAPSMPEAPHQFKLSASLSGEFWEDGGDARGDVDDHALYGLELERTLIRYLALRAGGAFGPTSVRREGETLDLDQYTIDVELLGRADFGPFRRLGAIPVVALSIGAVVHDPTGSDLRTRSQTALGYGAGLEVALTPRIGLQADWRRLTVDLEDAFAPTSREGAKVDADRLRAGVFWRF